MTRKEHLIEAVHALNRNNTTLLARARKQASLINEDVWQLEPDLEDYAQEIVDHIAQAQATCQVLWEYLRARGYPIDG